MALIDSSVAAAYAESVQVFGRLGAEIVAVPFADICDATGDAVGAMIATEGYAVVHQTVDDEAAHMDPAVRMRFRTGRGISALDYFKLLDHREETRSRAELRIAGVDAAAAAHLPDAADYRGGSRRGRATAQPLYQGSNYLGWCGLALPNGATADGLPISLQILGRAFGEAAILRVGWAFEQATVWHERHPAL